MSRGAFVSRGGSSAALVATVYLLWTVREAVDTNDKDVFPPLLPALIGIGALGFAVLLVYAGRSLAAFTATALGVVATVATLFVSLYPRVMVSSTDFSNSLTVDGASSSNYALKVMTIVAVTVTPLILLYQGWTFYVFRHRLGLDEEPAAAEAPGLPPQTGPVS